MLSKVTDDPKKMKGTMIILNISSIKREKNNKAMVIASEGEYIERKLVKGKIYYSDGKEEIV